MLLWPSFVVIAFVILHILILFCIKSSSMLCRCYDSCCHWVIFYCNWIGCFSSLRVVLCYTDILGVSVDDCCWVSYWGEPHASETLVLSTIRKK